MDNVTGLIRKEDFKLLSVWSKEIAEPMEVIKGFYVFGVNSYSSSLLVNANGDVSRITRSAKTNVDHKRYIYGVSDMYCVNCGNFDATAYTDTIIMDSVRCHSCNMISFILFGFDSDIFSLAKPYKLYPRWRWSCRQ